MTHVGEFYSFKIRAFNEIDSTTSGAEQMLLAAVPDKPTLKPTQNFALTTQSQIKVEYTALSLIQNGGSEIIGY